MGSMFSASLTSSLRLKILSFTLLICMAGKPLFASPLRQLEKPLKDQFMVRRALEKALGYKSSAIDSSNDSSMPKLDKREPDDSFLSLVIWTPGETSQSNEPPEICCNSQETADPREKMGQQFPPSSLYLLAFITFICLNILHLKAEASRKVYIVYLGEKQHEDPNVVTATHHDMLTAVLGSKEEALTSILYNYKHGFSGFAAMLTDSQAKAVAELPEVVSIRPSQVYKIQTTRSWDYLGLNYDQTKGLLHDSHLGEDIIIGVVDTGIWPESPSFSDAGFGPIPSRWKGICQTGEAFSANNCSRKIIGARWYTKGVDPEVLKGDYLSARDVNDHGTHTASTAAGVLVRNVSFHGLAAGAARGGAPRARLAIYKACWGAGGSCYEAAVLKAFDHAIHDGVDVLSLSLSGNGYAEGSFNAVAKGMTVVFAGGNNGPTTQTVANDLPWVTTVAASTLDRSFPTVITLGNGQNLVGQAINYQTEKDDIFKPLFYGGGSCGVDLLNSSDVAGSIVLCYDFTSPISFSLPLQIERAIQVVNQAKGAGLIFAIYSSNNIDVIESCNDLHLTCVFVDFGMANQIRNYYINSDKPKVKVRPTKSVIGQSVLSPNVGFFSSRGPSVSYPELLKPDVAAPGVCILAAVKNSYHFESGTSMACPHVSGIAALLKAIHPSWSPAAIKSALVTTALITNEHGWPIESEGVPRKIADPFDFGGGNVNPNRAADPGLIYDIDPKDYLKYFQCTIGTDDACDSTKPLYYLNLPSISIPNLKKKVTVSRTVTNVGSTNAIYEAIPESPPGVKMVVEPPVLVFNATHKVNTFKVSFTATAKVQGDYTFGSLTWYDKDDHRVRIPIAARIVIQDFFADTS
ncbi:hypothetical protein J5N97_019115 [Dioscorea zingiberensis]|uniref:Uncharacterized protein n=1 Tax=Dioscorea zingiberensis TaxID=325984 RepID=A0A9D5CDH0_9LILI|nr:hypothetical protein J5N97_019115 [Dioscorea zingiberensis]